MDRTVEVEVAVPVVERVEVPMTPKGAGWADALQELTRQIDAGKIYDRDLPAIASGVDALVTALARRSGRARRTQSTERTPELLALRPG